LCTIYGKTSTERFHQHTSASTLEDTNELLTAAKVTK